MIDPEKLDTIISRLTTRYVGLGSHPHQVVLMAEKMAQEEGLTLNELKQAMKEFGGDGERIAAILSPPD